jgi:iron complex outermembrane recepter protein
MKTMYTGASAAVLAFAISGQALAQSAEVQKDAAGEVEAVIVTGTRQVGIRAADSAAPVQVIGAAQMKETGSTDLASILQVSVPSFNVSTNQGDAAGVQVLANLRGLNPDDTLVLVDGKRRHTTSNLAVDSGTVFSGAAAVDLSFIPTDAIDHVEVLTDGASALYGSDAVAGVVNIILKKNASGGYLTGQGGTYYNGQGLSGQFAYHGGMSLGEDKGFFDMTLEARYHDFSTLGFGDTRCLTATGAPTNSVSCPAFMATGAPNAPHQNRVNGDPEFANYNSFFNAGYNVTPDIQVYGFGNLSYNTSQHFENYRTGYILGGCEATTVGGALVVGSGYSTATGTCKVGTPAYYAPTGFDPKEQFNQTDYSFTGGVKGETVGWNWDFSGTYGGNHTQVNVLDTGNATVAQNLQSVSTTPITYPIHTLYDGSFDATELVGQVDVTKDFNVGYFAAPLSVAFGLTGRRDTYGISAGEPESYTGGGAQSFAGYNPGDATNVQRTNYAGYLDFGTNPIKNLKLDIAGRFEHFSDFGDSKTGRVTARYDFSDAFALRGTISDGFRAPTLAEEYYAGLNVGPTSVSGQLPPDGAAAQGAGFPSLTAEQSINYSLGVVLHPASRLQITIDAYHIILTDRILPSPSFSGLGAECVPNGTTVPTSPAVLTLTCPAGKTAENVILSQGILNTVTGLGVTTAGLTSVGLAAFMNAVNSDTDGVDLTANYSSDFGGYGHVDWTVGANYNHTYITSIGALPAAVAITNPAIISLGVQQTKFLNQISQSALTTAQPREKVILQALWTKGPWAVNLRSTIYSGMEQYANYPTLNANVLQTIPTTAIFDLNVSYKWNQHVRFDVGANDLFNTLPPITPLGSTGQPITGSNVYRLPYGFSPWGVNGGSYYGRVTFSF